MRTKNKRNKRKRREINGRRDEEGKRKWTKIKVKKIK